MYYSYESREVIWSLIQQGLNETQIDENIITSYCAQTASKVAFTLLEMLIGKEKTDDVRVAMGYK